MNSSRINIAAIELKSNNDYDLLILIITIIKVL